jgi:hypothetical protein
MGDNSPKQTIRMIKTGIRQMARAAMEMARAKNGMAMMETAIMIQKKRTRKKN